LSSASKILTLEKTQIKFGFLLAYSYLCSVITKKGSDMSKDALNSLRDYLTGTLSPSNMLWLSIQLADYARQQEPLKPYTMAEINDMIDRSERDIDEGRVYDFDEAMDELEKEFAEEDRKLATAEAI